MSLLLLLGAGGTPVDAKVTWLQLDTDADAATTPDRNMGFEAGHVNEVNRKPLLVRIQEAYDASQHEKLKIEASKNQKDKIRKIEIQAIREANSGNEEKFNELMQSWVKRVPPSNIEDDVNNLFLVQVALRMQMQIEDDEEAILAILLSY